MTSQQTTLIAGALRPGDDGYDTAARAFFGTGRPELVVRPGEPEEVAVALRHAAAHRLAVSVRSGGHSPLGHGTDTGGMVIDLRRLDHVEILDVERRLVRVGGGATWGRVAAALAPYHWAITAGDTNDVGVGGLTLGGGIGWMVRQHGLTIDNLVGARVITADGRLLTTSVAEHPDLFWALRGGGGNFGVVVDFDFIAQPVRTVHFGTVAYPFDDPAGLIARWRDVMEAAPEELSSTLALTPRMPGATPSVVLLLCYAGSPGATTSEADAAIRPLLGLGTSTAVSISRCDYAEILEDAAHPRGFRLAVRNALVPTLDDATIAEVLHVHESGVPTAIAVRSLGGAFSRVPSDATAFAHRDASAMIVALLMLPDAATEAEIEQALVPWQGVAAQGIGSYVNFQGAATAADLAAAYPPETSSRLAGIKHRYDPDNRFAVNHNIQPVRRNRSATDGSPSGTQKREVRSR
jgi:FAD/FMN-containing dehydrogenase